MPTRAWFWPALVGASCVLLTAALAGHALCVPDALSVLSCVQLDGELATGLYTPQGRRGHAHLGRAVIIHLLSGLGHSPPSWSVPGRDARCPALSTSENWGGPETADRVQLQSVSSAAPYLEGRVLMTQGGEACLSRTCWNHETAGGPEGQALDLAGHRELTLQVSFLLARLPPQAPSWS